MKKLLGMFLVQNPGMSLSYEKLRQTSELHYNISFGYPRTDTCVTCCDEQKLKKTALIKSLENSLGDDRDKIEKELKDLQNKIKLHKLKAEWFYRKKRTARLGCRKSQKKEAISMDFGRNISLPDISTSEVYFRRQ